MPASSRQTVSSRKLAAQVESRIILLRGLKVMLDFHLAELYQVDAHTPERTKSKS
jgi:hypothetical protein